VVLCVHREICDARIDEGISGRAVQTLSNIHILILALSLAVGVSIDETFNATGAIAREEDLAAAS